MKILSRKSSEHWRTYTYCAIDVETTGLDLKSDEVISIGAVTVLDGRFSNTGNFYEVVKPAKTPSAESIRIHGLRPSDLESAPTIEGVAKELAEYTTGKIFITHARWVEEAFLSGPFKGARAKYPKRVIDTASLARHLGVVETTSAREPSLELLAKTLNLPVFAPHHALGDAMTTAAVFLALANRMDAERSRNRDKPLTLNELLLISRR